MSLADSPTSHTLLGDLALIISASAWPIIFLVVLLTQKERIKTLLLALIEIVKDSTNIKIGEVELSRKIGTTLANVAAAAVPQDGESGVPAREIAASQEVAQLIAAAKSEEEKKDLTSSVHLRMLALARDYESTRASMSAGSARTVKMNSVMAQMRALAAACRPYLAQLKRSDAAGERLAAIAILQVSPDGDSISWLADRMGIEVPFVFFHASVAMLASVRSFGLTKKQLLLSNLEKSLEVVTKFHTPDMNTVKVLKLAVLELDEADQVASLRTN